MIQRVWILPVLVFLLLATTPAVAERRYHFQPIVCRGPDPKLFPSKFIQKGSYFNLYPVMKKGASKSIGKLEIINDEGLASLNFTGTQLKFLSKSENQDLCGTTPTQLWGIDQNGKKHLFYLRLKFKNDLLENFLFIGVSLGRTAVVDVLSGLNAKQVYSQSVTEEEKDALEKMLSKALKKTDIQKNLQIFQHLGRKQFEELILKLSRNSWVKRKPLTIVIPEREPDKSWYMDRFPPRIKTPNFRKTLMSSPVSISSREDIVKLDEIERFLNSVSRQYCGLK